MLENFIHKASENGWMRMVSGVWVCTVVITCINEWNGMLDTVCMHVCMCVCVMRWKFYVIWSSRDQPRKMEFYMRRTIVSILMKICVFSTTHFILGCLCSVVLRILFVMNEFMFRHTPIFLIFYSILTNWITNNGTGENKHH